jgi:hypothetical protein
VFKPFQAFLKSYMGDYISCLLETGELPSLGNPDTQNILDEAGCDAEYQPASVAGGRPSRSKGSTSANSVAQKSSSSVSGDSDGSGGSGGGGGGGTSSSRGGNLLISSMKKKTATETGGGNDGKKTEIPLAENSSFYSRKDSFSSEARAKVTKTTYIGIAGVTDEEKKKQERKEGNRRIVASGEDIGPALKKISIKKSEAKIQTEPEDTPLTFGNFFRFLLIAAIIIAILVVLGSQALKIAKSQEK